MKTYPTHTNPDILLARILDLAKARGIQLDAATVALLRDALHEKGQEFATALKEFKAEYGPSPIDDDDLAGLRSPDPGRTSPFS